MPHPTNPEHRLRLVQGAVRRDEPARPGRRSSYWVGAQSLYGNPGKDLILRFQRVSPMATSPHDPEILYYGSQYLHRTRDKGVTWEKISPDLTAYPAVLPGRERRADHARRHRRGVLQHALRDHRVAARDGRDLDRLERRPVPRHARQRQDLDERHAEGSAGPAAACSGSTRRRTAAARRTSRSIATCSATTRRTSTDRRLRQDVDAADRRQERHSGRHADARRPRRSGSRRACSTPAPSSGCTSRSTTARTGSRST